MSVRLGISPIGWSNDDLPELGGDIPLDTCLAEAHELGFEGIELSHKFPRDPVLLGRLLAYHGLRLISGWYSGRLLERSIAEELEAIEPQRPCSPRWGARFWSMPKPAEASPAIETGRYRADRDYLMENGRISASGSPSWPTAWRSVVSA
jgi:hypothetical protein